MSGAAAPGVPGGAREHRAAAEAAAADLAAWAARYPILDAARIPAVALTVATHLPDLGREERALAAAMTMWIFAFDAAVDERWLGDSATDALAAECKAMSGMLGSGDCPPVGGGGRAGELGGMLRELVARLGERRPSPLLVAHWRETFGAMVDGILRERAAPGPGAPVPSYESLLASATHSIGVPHYLATCFILRGDPGLARHLPGLVAIAEECARAIRLANDLRTWEKEEREGVLNTVVVVRRELARAHPGWGEARVRACALDLLRARRDAHAGRAIALIAVAPPQPAVAGIARLLSFVIDFYGAHDYHTFRPEERG